MLLANQQVSGEYVPIYIANARPYGHGTSRAPRLFEQSRICAISQKCTIAQTFTIGYSTVQMPDSNTHVKVARLTVRPISSEVHRICQSGCSLQALLRERHRCKHILHHPTLSARFDSLHEVTSLFSFGWPRMLPLRVSSVFNRSVNLRLGTPVSAFNCTLIRHHDDFHGGFCLINQRSSRSHCITVPSSLAPNRLPPSAYRHYLGRRWAIICVADDQGCHRALYRAICRS